MTGQKFVDLKVETKEGAQMAAFQVFLSDAMLRLRFQPAFTACMKISSLGFYFFVSKPSQLLSPLIARLKSQRWRPVVTSHL